MLLRRRGRRGRPFHVIGGAIKREKNTAESLLSRLYSFLACFFLSFLSFLSFLYLTFFLTLLFYFSLCSHFNPFSHSHIFQFSTTLHRFLISFTVYYLLLAVYCSLLTVYNLPFTIYCLLLTTDTEQFVNVGYWRTLLKLSP